MGTTEDAVAEHIINTVMAQPDAASVPDAATAADAILSGPIANVVLGEPVDSIDPTTVTGLERACQAVTSFVTELEQINAAIDQATAQLRQLNPALDAHLTALEARRAALQGQREAQDTFIKAAVLRLGKTYKMGRVTAVWNDGRESADIAMLKGMAAFYPQIKNALKRGEPSVSIRVK